MTQDELKRAVAKAALDYILPKTRPDDILGIGTGSTSNCFIDLLGGHRHVFKAAVASSVASAERLEALGIQVVDLNQVSELRFYVDGADESTPNLELIKGGGGALTREKVVAAVAQTFVCIADSSKWVSQLGRFPLPVEVIPLAREYVARQLAKLGGRPVHRPGVITDNGCDILDVYDLVIHDPKAMEASINQIPGVVTNGLFAHRGADVLLLGEEDGVRILFPQPQL